ncbi:MAG: hypothetical protein O2992_03425 [Gemmatimonadetes bacterium]|nr:hypothetical protein [Gemmatimonadota bacterium]
MIEVVVHAGALAFLSRAEAWLLLDEAQYNLPLSLAYARATSEAEPDTLFATVEQSGSVVGCVIRTPPHKLWVTAMPSSTTAAVAAHVAYGVRSGAVNLPFEIPTVAFIAFLGVMFPLLALLRRGNL